MGRGREKERGKKRKEEGRGGGKKERGRSGGGAGGVERPLHTSRQYTVFEQRASAL